MPYLFLLIVAALVFGLCYLVDKGFTKIFRGRDQHRSGLSVRLSKRYGSMGLIIAVLGLAAVFAGVNGSITILTVCGGILIVMGICLVVYFMTFGVFYDDNSFLVTTFGKRTTEYTYRDIKGQQLFNSSGNIVIELYMTDGRSVQLQSAMDGVYPFLDHAFAAWCRQTGRAEEDCDFHDPQNSCWFPRVEA